MPRGSNRKAGAPGLPGAGPKPKYLTLRVPIVSGRIPIAIDNDAAALAPRLLLHFPECGTVEGLVSYAVRRLAETTDD